MVQIIGFGEKLMISENGIVMNRKDYKVPKRYNYTQNDDNYPPQCNY